MERAQLIQYVPVLMLLVLAAAFTGGMLVASVLLGRWANRGRLHQPAPQIKNTAWECGMLPIGEGSARLSVKFYLVAMLFILFDVEVVFLYPWAVVYRDMLQTHAGVILGSMISFLLVLLVGYFYALRKRAFEWKS